MFSEHFQLMYFYYCPLLRVCRDPDTWLQAQCHSTQEHSKKLFKNNLNGDTEATGLDLLTPVCHQCLVVEVNT